MLVRDRDSKFGPEFNRALEEFGVRQTRLPHRSPNLNAHAERFIKTLKVECLDRFIIMGTKHLDHLVGEFIDYYNRQRPHSGIGGATPMRMSRSAKLRSNRSNSAAEKVRCAAAGGSAA